MLTNRKRLQAFFLLLSLLWSAGAEAQRRLVLIDQDSSGPADSNTMSMMVLLQSPQAEVLGITVVTGNAWRDVEVKHALRMLELIGRSEVPVVPGAVFPLVRTEEETRLGMQLIGKPSWVGAWGRQTTDLAPPAGSVLAKTRTHGPWEIPPLPEGMPQTKPLAEDAPHFLIRQVRAHPGQVTIYAAGPLTNIALAVAIDPQFAELTRGIVIMGSSMNPQTDDPEFATSPRHEFNFWFDPEAARIVLRAHWPRIDVTTVDVSIKGDVHPGDVRRHLAIVESCGTVHLQVFQGALLPVGRTRRLRVARSEYYYEDPRGIWTWISATDRVMVTRSPGPRS
jgi:purine nucleosidase